MLTRISLIGKRLASSNDVGPAEMKKDTRITRTGRDLKPTPSAVNPPVYHASTVVFESLAELRAAWPKRANRPYYGRYGMPTAFALRAAMTELEGGFGTMLFPSGLAAITQTMLAFVSAGDHILMTDSAYGPTRQFCTDTLKRLGVETTFYDPLIGARLADLMRENTSLVFLESPGSLTFEVQDVPAIAAVARDHGAISLIDNTWATPYFFRPLAHGIDVVIEAATKFIVGHSDAMLGTVTANQATWPRLEHTTFRLGQCAAPDDIYLALRGLRTLAVRLERHQKNGLEVARWLANRPEVARALHPALDGDPGHALWRRDFDGAPGVFGVALKCGDERAVAALIDGLKLFGIGYSWGGFESLIVPTKAERAIRPYDGPGPLLRLHVGLEDPDDLIADLEAGLKRFNQALSR